MKYIIISNGSFDSRVADEIEWQEYGKICVDGGIRHFYSLGITPDIIIGDLDSADPEMIEHFRLKGVKILEYPCKKDKTDTEIAVEYAIESGAKEILFLGLTGSRIDHMLGGISLIYRLRRQGINCSIVDYNNEISIIEGKTEVCKSDYYDYISLLPYGGDAKSVSLKGFAYDLVKRDFFVGETLGISNEIKLGKASIDIGEGYMVLIKAKE
jgi:thiamine pyrophosphokinase